MKLYTVTTSVGEYHGCKNVRFRWFRNEPSGLPRPYAELIADYDPEDPGADYGLAEDCIDQLFTENEALALADYLQNWREGTTEISEEALPIPNDMMGYGAIAVGGGDDFYMLDREPGYSLPFKVWGYFDLVDCELVDGSGVYHERLLIFEAATGELRQQTNEEAARDADAANRRSFQ